jgi:hypothetical protein
LKRCKRYPCLDHSAYEERIKAASKEEAKGIACRSEHKLARSTGRAVASPESQELLELQKEDREERVMNVDLKKMAPFHGFASINC